MTVDLALEIIGTIVGVLYLYYEYKANALVWIMGAIMPAISLIVYYNAGLYADFGINIYYLIAAIYGYIAWTFHKSKKEKKELPITSTPLRYYIPAAIITIILFIAISYILINFTDSNIPLCDSLTTALSIIAMWMMARKFIEQWIVWLAVDIISVGLYIYKDIYFYATLYAIYSIVAIFGYFNWEKLMQHDNNRSI